MPRGNNNNKKKGAAKDPPGKAKANKQPRIEPQEAPPRVSQRNKERQERKAQPEQQPQQQAAAASRRPRVSVGSAQSASSSSDSESISNFMRNRNKKRAAKINKETNDGSGLDDDGDSQEMLPQKKDLEGVGVHLTIGIFSPSHYTTFKHITLIAGAKHTATALTIDSKFEEVKTVVQALLAKAAAPHVFAPHNQSGATLFVRQQKQEEKETPVTAPPKAKQTQAISTDEEWASALLTIAHHERKEPATDDSWEDPGGEEAEKISGIYLDLLCCAKQQRKAKSSQPEASQPTATKTVIHLTFNLHSAIESKVDSDGLHTGYRSQNTSSVKVGEKVFDMDNPPVFNEFYTPLYAKAQGNSLYGPLALFPSLWVQERVNTTHFLEVKSGADIMNFVTKKKKKMNTNDTHPANENHYRCELGFAFARKKDDDDANVSDAEASQVDSQDVAAGLVSSPPKTKPKITGKQARQKQTSSPKDIDKFVLRLYKDDCQWNCFYYGLTWEHSLHLRKWLLVWKKENQSAHEVFELKQDQQNTWPTFKDFFEYTSDGTVVDLDNNFGGHQPKRGEYPPDPAGNLPRRGESSNNHSSGSGKEGGGPLTLAESQNNIAKAHARNAEATAGRYLPKNVQVQVTNKHSKIASPCFDVPLGTGLNLLDGIYKNPALRFGGPGKSARSFSKNISDAVTGDGTTPPSKKICLELASKAHEKAISIWDVDAMQLISVDSLYRMSSKETGDFIEMKLMAVDIKSGTNDEEDMVEI